MPLSKKILFIGPSLPFPETGAEQSDRAHGIRQLVRLGYDVRVITKLIRGRENLVALAEKEFGAPITAVPYLFEGKTLRGIARRLLHPGFLDGAAFEYADKLTMDTVRTAITTFKPDIVWFEYTYLWPLYTIAREAGIPIVTRSVNFEPRHFLDEDGRTLWNFLKVIPKYWSERMVGKLSDIIFTITPHEEEIYKAFARGHVVTLPLRGLHTMLDEVRSPRDKQILDVVFMGSAYSVAHNREAARFLIEEIAPAVEKAFPNTFHFHITGAKLPTELQKQLPTSVTYEGYIDDLNTFLHDMDCAIVPSLFGAGMQQKIFEPITRGIPTVTDPRGIAEYPFEDGVEYLAAHSCRDYVEALGQLRDIEIRHRVGTGGQTRARQLFSKDAIDTTVTRALNTLPHMTESR